MIDGEPSQIPEVRNSFLRLPAPARPPLLQRREELRAAWLVAAPIKGLGLLACGIGIVWTVAMFVVLSPVVAVGRGTWSRRMVV